MKPEKNLNLPLPLTEHLRQLRTLVIRGGIAIALASSVTLYFSKELYTWLSIPLMDAMPSNASLIAIHPIEAWLVYLKVGLLSGTLLAAPYLGVLIWRFIAPGLYENEKRIIFPLGITCGLLFVGGATFGYFVVFPIGFKALIAVIGDMPIRFLPGMENYFSFASMLLIAFGCVFELPLIIIGLTGTGLVSFEKLRALRKYMVVIALTIGAILTPPDPISQILMAIPLMILFEVGMAIAWLLYRKKIQSPLPTQS